jgi:hypothetical protein
MARKRNHERTVEFARLLASGVTAVDAYERAGWRRDSANASRLANTAKVRRLVEELRRVAAVEAAERKLDTASGAELLRLAATKAIVTGDLSALVSAGAKLGGADGSLESLQPDKEMKISEMLALADSLSPIMGFETRVLLMLIDGDTGQPLPPWENARGEPPPPYLRSDYTLVE